jgi:sugar/nucleoside kinase (ribokinase family)
MMEVLVVGSVALDTIETPQGKVEDVLGGSASYFCCACSFFAPVRLVAVVGPDFDQKHVKMLRERGVDTAGLVVAEGRTLRWHGRYFGSGDKRETVSVEPQIMLDFRPTIPKEYMKTRFVFLANCNPGLQLHVARQVEPGATVFADTMDIWIETQRDEVVELLGEIDGIILNDQEAGHLSGEHDLIAAGKAVSAMGPGTVVVKKGSHGALMLVGGEVISLPAYPMREGVCDPTGAGDSFAGAFMGALAMSGELTPAAAKQALAFATVVSTFCIEKFSLERFREIGRPDIERRYEEYRRMLAVGPVEGQAWRK